MQILLKDILLYGYHGITPLENICGTQFKVDLVVSLKKGTTTTVLEETVDYVQLYTILKTEFKRTNALLEVLAESILSIIIDKFSAQIEEAEITIYKINAAVEGLQGQLGVRAVKKVL